MSFFFCVEKLKEKKKEATFSLFSFFFNRFCASKLKSDKRKKQSG